MANQIQSVYLHSAPEDQEMLSGKQQAQRIRAEEVDSFNIIVRSQDRTYGSDFNFQIDLLTSTAQMRKMRLAKIFCPILPQINENNKSVTVTHTDGTITFNLIPGYYSVQGLVNMMQSEFLTAWLGLNAANALTISYDIDRRSLSIVDDTGDFFYIHDDCPFALYARGVVKFPVEASGTAVSTVSIESLSLTMIYSRYILLSSDRLTQDQRSFSIISGRGASNVVAVVDIASQYSASQYSVSSSFPGTDVVVDTLQYAPLINMNNRYKSLKVIDFGMHDEYGFSLDNLNTPTYNFEYAVSMWFQCYL
jgi:hypothetical protein